MPNTPATSGCSSPSTTVRWAHRKRTIACAVVSRTVFIACLHGARGRRHRQARVEFHVVPGGADPVLRRVVGEGELARARIGRHHVEVVERVAGRRDARAVVARRHEEHVAVAHDHGLVDRAIVGVRAVHGVAVGGIRDPADAADAEVVDLLVVHLALGRGVVLVRRIARPVAVGCQHLAADQLVGAVEDLGHHEVGELPGRLARAAQLDRDVARLDVGGVEAPRCARRGERELAAGRRGDAQLGVDRDVGPVGDACEDALAPVQLEAPALDLDRARAAGQRQHGDLVRAAREHARRAGRKAHDT